MITIITKYPDTLSARLSILDFSLPASVTSLTISEIVEFLPNFSAFYSMYPS